VFHRRQTSINLPRFHFSEPKNQRPDAELFDMQQVLGRTRDRLLIEQKRLEKELSETRIGQADASQRIFTKLQQTIVERQQVASDISRIQLHLRGGKSVLIDDTAASSPKPSTTKGLASDLSGPGEADKRQGENDEFLVSYRDLCKIAGRRARKNTVRDLLRRNKVNHRGTGPRGVLLFRYSDVLAVWSDDHMRETLPHDENVARRKLPK